MDRLDRFRQKRRNAQDFNVLQFRCSGIQRNRVRYHNLLNIRIAQMLCRTTREYRMCETCVNPSRARLFQGLGNFSQRAAGVAHVVHYQTTSAFNIADDIHHFGNVRLITALVTKGQLGIQPLGVSSGTFGAARVRRYYHR